MLKKNKLLIILGTVCVVLGIYIFLVSNDGKDIDKYKIKVNTSNKTGDIIDISNYDYYSPSKKHQKIHFRSMNVDVKNSYTLNITEDFDKFWENDVSNAYSVNGMTFNAYCILEDDIESYKKSLIQHYYDTNDKVNYSSSEEKIYISDVEIEYLKINASRWIVRDDETEGDYYTETFIVLIKESDDSLCSMTYSINNEKFSDKFLTEFINQLVIEKNTANYLYSKIEGENIIGTLTNEISNNNINSLSYKIPSNKYKEIEDSRNLVSSTTFSLMEDEFVKVNISLNSINKSDNFVNDYIEGIKLEHTSNNINLNEIVWNETSYGEDECYEFDFNYYDEFSKLNYGKRVVFELENNSYYIISVNSNSIIDKNIILDFLDYVNN